MCIGSWGLSLSSTRVGGGSCTHGDESIEERCERLVGMAMCVVRHVWGESHELAHAEHKLRAHGQREATARMPFEEPPALSEI